MGPSELSDNQIIIINYDLLQTVTACNCEDRTGAVADHMHVSAGTGERVGRGRLITSGFGSLQLQMFGHDVISPEAVARALPAAGQRQAEQRGSGSGCEEAQCGRRAAAN